VTTSRPRRARSRTTPSAPPAALERIKALRDELDARSAEQQQREDQLLADYLHAVEEKANIARRRDTKITELQQQIHRVTEEAEQALAASEQCADAALVGLFKRRSAPQLSILVGLSAKEIRKRVRAHNATNSSTAPTELCPEKDTTARTAGVCTEEFQRPLPAPDDDPTVPPEPATGLAAATATEPEPTPASDSTPTPDSSDSHPETVRRPSTDDTDRLF
jgi:hypothetical protein